MRIWAILLAGGRQGASLRTSSGRRLCHPGLASATNCVSGELSACRPYQARVDARSAPHRRAIGQSPQRKPNPVLCCSAPIGAGRRGAHRVRSLMRPRNQGCHRVQRSGGRCEPARSERATSRTRRRERRQEPRATLRAGRVPVQYGRPPTRARRRLEHCQYPGDASTDSISA